MLPQPEAPVATVDVALAHARRLLADRPALAAQQARVSGGAEDMARSRRVGTLEIPDRREVIGEQAQRLPEIRLQSERPAQCRDCRVAVTGFTQRSAELAVRRG